MKISHIASAVLALALGSSANLAMANGNPHNTPSVPTLASCSGTDISIAGATCLGFFSGNLNGNGPSVSAINTDLASWGVHLAGAVNNAFMLSGLGNNNPTKTINFTQQLFGDTIVGIHFGVVNDGHTTSNNVTGFYRFNAGALAGIDSFTTKFASLSDATLFRTGRPTSPVPEPETYGMLLAGLGLVGWMARRRKSN